MKESDTKRLGELKIACGPGRERQASEEVARIVKEALDLPLPRLEQLKTATAEAVLNAMEHGNQYRPDLPVEITILASPTRLSVVVQDYGDPPAYSEAEDPDLDAKLAGLQSPRGWGLFLIKNMVDELVITTREGLHTLELILYLDQGP